MYYHQVVLPYLVNSVFWCPYPSLYTVPHPIWNGHPPQFSGFGNSNPGFGIGLNSYQPPIFSYSSCKIGAWKPHSCIDCYCVNGYASRCFLNPSCSDSNSNSGVSPTTMATTQSTTATSPPATASTIEPESEPSSNMETNDAGMKSKRGNAPVSVSSAQAQPLVASLPSRRGSLVSTLLSPSASLTSSVSLAEPNENEKPGNPKRTIPIVTNNFLLNTHDNHKDIQDIKDLEQKSHALYVNNVNLDGVKNTEERKETTVSITVQKSVQDPALDSSSDTNQKSAVLPERRMHDFYLFSNS